VAVKYCIDWLVGIFFWSSTKDRKVLEDFVLLDLVSHPVLPCIDYLSLSPDVGTRVVGHYVLQTGVEDGVRVQSRTISPLDSIKHQTSRLLLDAVCCC